MCSNFLTIEQIYTKFLSWIHLIRIHHILPVPRFFICPTFQGHRGQTMKFYDLLQHLNYQADLHQIFIMDTSNKDISHITQVFYFTYFSRSQRTTFENFTICSNTLTIGRIFTKFLSWIHPIRIHHIHVLPRFLILPTFQCHRGQTLFFYDLPQHLNYWVNLHQIFIHGKI
jgi:hypothetical protein